MSKLKRRGHIIVDHRIIPKYLVWQQNNRPKILLHPKFISHKIQYLHLNPVQAGIIEKTEDYLHSARSYLGYCDLKIVQLRV